MGCDIHVYTEVLSTVNGEKIWRSADLYKLNHYFNVTDLDDGEPEYVVHPVYNSRNYELFGALAGVRVRLDDSPLLSEPKGIPGDCSPPTKAANDYWNGDGHSHSHSTLAELYKFRKENAPLRRSGLMSPENAERLDSGVGEPTEWCQGTSIQDYVHRVWTPRDSILDDFINAVESRAKDELWVFGDGPVPSDKAESFRIVFWFDN